MEQTSFEFVNPRVLWLLLLVPALAAFYIWKGHRQYPFLWMSSTRAFRFHTDWVARFRPVLYVLRLVALTLIIVAMARPREVEVSSKTFSNNGIDIVMAMDVSASMLARDLKPNRLEALKEVASQFIENRKGDRIALVTYASESYTATPLTTDKEMVINTLRSTREGLIDASSTAIGVGLGSAINRLRHSDAKSKVIILLTDGVNNSGFIDPMTAAEMAREHEFKVYTIGIGTNGMAQVPSRINPMTGEYTYSMARVEIDEALLKEIATMTGGKYFRATDNTKLKAIYDEIDSMEKSKVEDVKYYAYDEKFRTLVLWALILLVVELLLRNTIYRSFI